MSYIGPTASYETSIQIPTCDALTIFWIWDCVRTQKLCWFFTEEDLSEIYWCKFWGSPSAAYEIQRGFVLILKLADNICLLWISIGGVACRLYVSANTIEQWAPTPLKTLWEACTLPPLFCNNSKSKGRLPGLHFITDTFWLISQQKKLNVSTKPKRKCLGV